MGESVAVYIAELRWLTAHSSYGTHLNVALRDIYTGLWATQLSVQKRRDWHCKKKDVQSREVNYAVIGSDQEQGMRRMDYHFK